MPTASSKKPAVTFVVPCYKLAHLLPECLDSILGQTFEDFEILVMDDKSPDNTAEVVARYDDPRVKYHRNDPNLGSLRNYNHGITLAEGKYVWLISADDVLRRPHVLERYVEVLEANPKVGYTFCAGVGLQDGKETGLLEYAAYSKYDRVMEGHVFLKDLMKRNIVLAPSGLVRKECYEKVSLFPLDEGMIFSGDWFLWCIFAFYYDVAYFAEPMVCYRQHDSSMTNTLNQRSPESLLAGRLVVPWKMKAVADEAGESAIARNALAALGSIYGQSLAKMAEGSEAMNAAMEAFENDIREKCSSDAERNWLRARVYAAMGSDYFWQGKRQLAKDYYSAGLSKDPMMLDVHLKKLRLAFGKFGNLLRREPLSVRQQSE